MTNKTPWIDTENGGVVALYFEMVDKATTGRPYNKAAMIRSYSKPVQGDGYYGISRPLANRSRGSIEFKLMNCSAAHADLVPGAETMHEHGYRAMPNYQSSLKDAMRSQLETRSPMIEAQA